MLLRAVKSIYEALVRVQVTILLLDTDNTEKKNVKFAYRKVMLVFRAGIHKIVVRIANREDPDQKQSDLCLRCLPRLFGRQLVM